MSYSKHFARGTAAAEAAAIAVLQVFEIRFPTMIMVFGVCTHNGKSTEY
jgi:hypothetical protein